jgi:UPF0176 protein
MLIHFIIDMGLIFLKFLNRNIITHIMGSNNDKNVVTSFYKYANIENPMQFQKEHLEFCKRLGLKGRILVGVEGLNGCVYGNMEQVQQYKKEITKNPLFSDMDFKDQPSNKVAYRKMFVRVREQIVNFGEKVDLENTADYLTPKEVKKILDNGEGAVLVDMRNDYEFSVGKFKGARTVSMHNFRELPEKLNEIKDLKEKRIITYCTGGIRCEKASAYLKENGFKNVSQIKGGILKYGEEFPDTYWEGKCFVFDDRLAISLNKKDAPMTDCAWCSEKSDNILNCHNLDCDKLFTSCAECSENHRKSCCDKCEAAPRRRKELAIVDN